MHTFLWLFDISFLFKHTYQKRIVTRTTYSLRDISGMTVLAQTYREDEARSKAMGVALGGVALGVLGR